LLEKIFGLLRIRHVTPLVFSQQFKVQHSLPEKIFSVTGCWRCTFISLWRRHHRGVDQCEDASMSPNSSLSSPASHIPCLPAAVPWLSRLHAIAGDPMESSRGLLGYFISTQMDLIDCVFVTMEKPHPWGSIINSNLRSPLLFIPS